MVTGVSGSGKSSLVFDTIYAEGQRRYVESLSSYARQFLERMEKPDVDEIAASRRPSRSGRRTPRAIRAPRWPLRPRSTIFCGCSSRAPDGAIARNAANGWSATRWIRWRSACSRSRRVALVRAVSGASRRRPRKRLRDHLFDLRKKGFNRLYQNGTGIRVLHPRIAAGNRFQQPVFILVDRIVISPDLHQRIVDTVEICYRESGEVIFEEATPQDPPPETLRFSEKFACKHCGIELSIPEPGLFSFNNPMGACPRCQGFGNTIDYDMDLVIPDKGLSLDEGAVDPWTKPQYGWYRQEFKKSARRQSSAERAIRRSGAAEDKRVRRTSTSAVSSPKWRRRSTKCMCACS